MNKILEPFQKIGAATLAANPHHLLADEPGLGKTLQAIAACHEVGARSVLVVCPASVRSNWALEVAGDQYFTDRRWDIISYNRAVDEAHGLEMLNSRKGWDALILDECHFLKTPESQRTQAVFGPHGLARKAHFKWCLTGTPVLNRPRELYPMLKTLCPAFADMTFARFAQRYCGAFWDGRGLNTKGATHVDELAGLLRTFMLRRTKREVFPDRKEPLVHKMPIELTREDLAAVRAAEDEIGGREVRISSRYDQFSQMGDTSKLLRLLGEAMVPQVCAFVDDMLETVDKVVVFAYHRTVIASYQEHFANRGYRPVFYWGGMTDAEKDAARGQFMNEAGCRVFIGQRTAAGIGINGLQTVCSTAVIAEPSWVPGETEQMIDRLDRMGQEDDIVNAYILYAPNTLSEVVLRVHDRKETIVDRLMGMGL